MSEAQEGASISPPDDSCEFSPEADILAHQRAAAQAQHDHFEATGEIITKNFDAPDASPLQENTPAESPDTTRQSQASSAMLPTMVPRRNREESMLLDERRLAKVENILNVARIGMHNARLDLQERHGEDSIQEWLEQRDAMRASLIDTYTTTMATLFGLLDHELDA